MCIWLGAILAGWEIGGSSYGPVNWHAHEMLFGYTAAALTGFLLTTIPNWTGRLPVSGNALVAIGLLWLAGRIVMAAPGLVGQGPSAAVDSAFLLVILAVAAREIVAGHNWRNLKVVAALALLAATNAAFHLAVATGADPAPVLRAAIAIYVCLIALVGGRIIPSFTRNWLVRAGAARLPAPFDRFDAASMIVLFLAMLCWTILPETIAAAALTAIASLLHFYRLLRWRGAAAVRDAMVAVLHVGYLFLPLGLLALSASALGWMSVISGLHLLTVGAIGNMTLAVMTRATMGHTGRPIRASRVTIVAFAAIFAAAIIRPLAEIAPDLYFPILAASGCAWIVAFILFGLEVGPMLLRARQSPPARMRVPAA